MSRMEHQLTYTGKSVLSLFSQLFAYSYLKFSLISFGIVMWEIIAREMSYHDRSFGWIQEVEDAVMRPTIPLGMAEDCYLHLMRCCWSTNPEQRPSFATVVTELVCMLPEDLDENDQEFTENETRV